MCPHPSGLPLCTRLPAVCLRSAAPPAGGAHGLVPGVPEPSPPSPDAVSRSSQGSKQWREGPLHACSGAATWNAWSPLAARREEAEKLRDVAELSGGAGGGAPTVWRMACALSTAPAKGHDAPWHGPQDTPSASPSHLVTCHTGKLPVWVD